CSPSTAAASSGVSCGPQAGRTGIATPEFGTPAADTGLSCGRDAANDHTGDFKMSQFVSRAGLAAALLLALQATSVPAALDTATAKAVDAAIAGEQRSAE